MRRAREAIALEYLERLAAVEEIELPPTDADRIHSWHLFPIRLQLESLTIDRNAFIKELNQAGIASSVHWRPLHLHPYYEETFRWHPTDLPASSAVWPRLVSLPLFSSMRSEEIDAVVNGVRAICARWSRRLTPAG